MPNLNLGVARMRTYALYTVPTLYFALYYCIRTVVQTEKNECNACSKRASLRHDTMIVAKRHGPFAWLPFCGSRRRRPRADDENEATGAPTKLFENGTATTVSWAVVLRCIPFVLVVSMIYLFLYSNSGIIDLLRDRQRVQSMIEKAGVFAPVVVILLFISLEALVFPGPVEALILAVAYSFPLVPAFLITVSGATIASTVTFLAVRLMLWSGNRSKVEISTIGTHGACSDLTHRMLKQIETRPVFCSFVIRMIPGGRAPIVTVAVATTSIDAIRCFIGTGLAATFTLGGICLSSSLAFQAST